VAEDAARAYDQKLVELHGATGWLGGVCGLVGWLGSGVQVVVLFVRLVVPDRVVSTQKVHPANPSTIQSCDSRKLGTCACVRTAKTLYLHHVWLLTQLIQPSVPAIAPVVSRHG
jgi:hypothetical protein